MNVEELQREVAKLSPMDRAELIRSLLPQHLPLDQDDRNRLIAEASSIPDDEWIQWNDVRDEFVKQ